MPIRFGKGFMAEINSLITPEDVAAMEASGEEPMFRKTPLPSHFKKDVRDMTDADIEEFAQWSQDHGQSVGVGINATFANMDIFMGMFRCYRCGKCCIGPLLDGIAIMPSEVKRISAHLKISTTAFMNKYVPKQRARLYGVMAYPCPFYKDRKCTIYPIRPIACRAFPMDFGVASSQAELGVQAFCPAAKDFFIMSAKERRRLFKKERS